jgi:hypothetical protein
MKHPTSDVATNSPYHQLVPQNFGERYCLKLVYLKSKNKINININISKLKL